MNLATWLQRMVYRLLSQKGKSIKKATRNNFYFVEWVGILPNHNCKTHSNRLLLASVLFYSLYIHKKTGRRLWASFLPACAGKPGR